MQPHVNDRVRLTRDLPELLLHRGDAGVVQSVWSFAPSCAYEVEFDAKAGFAQPRCLLGESELVVEEEQQELTCGA